MKLSGVLLACAIVAGLVSARAADWPQWRGPERTGISQETGLLKQWPPEGPKLNWQIKDLGGRLLDASRRCRSGVRDQQRRH